MQNVLNWLLLAEMLIIVVFTLVLIKLSQVTTSDFYDYCFPEEKIALVLLELMKYLV